MEMRAKTGPSAVRLNNNNVESSAFNR